MYTATCAEKDMNLFKLATNIPSLTDLAHRDSRSLMLKFFMYKYFKYYSQTVKIIKRM